MDKITRAQLIALGGAPNARFAVFRPDASLYFVTTAELALRDEDYWRWQGYELKEVVE